MIALLGLLLPVLLGHVALHAAIAAVTVTQWSEMAGLLIKLTPVIINLLKEVHPVFHTLHVEMMNHGNAHLAGHRAMEYLKTNAEAAIRVQDSLPH